MKIFCKRLIGALVVVASIVVVASVQAADPVRPKSRTLDQGEEEKLVMVTGSHIPQRVKRKSIGTDSVHNVRIYTRSELESTGRPTTAGALSIDPSIQISRGR